MLNDGSEDVLLSTLMQKVGKHVEKFKKLNHFNHSVSKGFLLLIDFKAWFEKCPMKKEEEKEILRDLY